MWNVDEKGCQPGFSQLPGMVTKFLVALVEKQGKTPSMALYCVETMLHDKKLIE